MQEDLLKILGSFSTYVPGASQLGLQPLLGVNPALSLLGIPGLANLDPKLIDMASLMAANQAATNPLTNPLVATGGPSAGGFKPFGVTAAPAGASTPLPATNGNGGTPTGAQQVSAERPREERHGAAASAGARKRKVRQVSSSEDLEDDDEDEEEDDSSEGDVRGGKRRARSNQGAGSTGAKPEDPSPTGGPFLPRTLPPSALPPPPPPPPKLGTDPTLALQAALGLNGLAGGLNLTPEILAAAAAGAAAAGVPGVPVAFNTGGLTRTPTVPDLTVRRNTSQKDMHLLEAGGHIDERELKRLKRKQSNRESARRSRMRKQAETEELADLNKRLASECAHLKSLLARSLDEIRRLRAFVPQRDQGTFNCDHIEREAGLQSETAPVGGAAVNNGAAAAAAVTAGQAAATANRVQGAAQAGPVAGNAAPAAPLPFTQQANAAVAMADLGGLAQLVQAAGLLGGR